MAEKALDANIQRDLVPARAEARAFTFATYTTSLLPYAALAFGFALVIMGFDGIGFLAVAVGLLSIGPHVIAATRRALAPDAPRELATSAGEPPSEEA